MKKIICSILIAYWFLSVAIWAQDSDFSNLNTLIPIDSSVTIGKFDNGFTYYLKTNKKPEKQG